MQTPHAIAAALDPNARSPAGHKLAPRIYMFDQIIELMLADSTITLKDIGLRLGRSQPWVSYVVHSDAFRDLYERRRQEQNSVVHREVAESLARVAKKSLSKLEEIFDHNPAKVTPQLALDVASMGLEKLGYGVKLPGQAVGAQVNVNVVSAEDFRHAQSLVRASPSPVLERTAPLLGSSAATETRPARLTPRHPEVELPLGDLLAKGGLRPPQTEPDEAEDPNVSKSIVGD